MGQSQARDTWAAVLGELQLQLPSSTYQTWLKDTVGLTLKDREMVVSVPDSFTAEWLEKRVYRLVHTTALKVAQRPLDVRFTIEGCSQTTTEDPGRAAPGPRARPKDTAWPNQRYSFSSFVIAPTNHLAFSAAEAVAEAPGQHYNPLFIYSGVGLGKTHLLQAITRRCMERRINCLYVTSERFTNDFITSVQKRTTEEFSSRYRSVDVLLMDDIQFMEGKERTQEGFFHTFNDLHNTNRQLVITSDRPPSMMPSLADRLRSRFAWGLVTDIQPPSLETRMDILQARAREIHASVDEDAIAYIAEHVRGNVRDLEGALNRLVAIARLTKQAATMELAQEALGPFLEEPHRLAHSPERILIAVSMVFNVEQSALLGSDRHRELAAARQVAMYLMRHDLGLAVTQIGRILGGKNHATISHGIQRVTSRLPSNAAFRGKVQAVKEELLTLSLKA